ncbi:MAG TPA: ABC transporter substrate binding protein [Sideroxyarcus sp.]|nr:ABC transporter substrate binding protein [Sideroxyarcus sp.]
MRAKGIKHCDASVSGGIVLAGLCAAVLLAAAAAPALAIPAAAEDTYRNEAPTGQVAAMAPSFAIPAFPESGHDVGDELIRNIEAFPDVVVFPVQVAGPAVAGLARNLANKVAQTSEAGSIAVIYPDIGEPYRSIFTQIIDGIEDKAKGRVANFAVGANVNVGELNDSLRRQETKVVIALGRQGVKVASALDGNIGVVVGGVLTAPEDEARNLQVNSLSPDPALLFARLKGLMPRAKRIFTVYDPRQNEWLMQLAKEGARAQGLELVAYQAQDLRTAMRVYQEILASVDTRQDALWLPQDSTTVEEGAVLPMVLQESWNLNLAVFSSSFGHVRRGVLFSLYPNNVELGRHLAGSALGFLASGKGDRSGVLPLREVLMAVNLRTAKHLGLNTSRTQSFDMAFPEQ